MQIAPANPSRTNLFVKCAVIGLLALGLSQPAAHAGDIIKSKLGFVAEGVVPAKAEEGKVDTLIKKDGKLLAKVENAIPVSFSPDGTILLLAEMAADDDCRHFLLNVAAGEYSKKGSQRLNWIIGGRSVTKAEWSADGKKLTLKSSKAMGAKAETIEVSKYCRPAAK